MVAFFLWGFIVEDDTYKSKQLQLTDSGRHEKGLNTRKHIKSEAASVTSKDRDTVAAVRSSPFRRGTTLSQQIEIAKLQTARSIEERRALDNKHATALLSLQNDIDNRMELAKMWQVADRNDPIIIEIQALMAEKRRLTDKFAGEQSSLSSKRGRDDKVLEEAFVVPKDSRREPSRLSSSSACWSISSLGDTTTPVSETNAPPVSVAFMGQKPVDDDIQDVFNIIQPSHRPQPPQSPTPFLESITDT
jgi:hypothetical protein